MIDHDARAKVRSAIDDYLNDRITAFQFDERLFGDVATNDATVNYICWQLWCIYDDCKDHLVHAEKKTWDAVQRIKLLLESDAELIQKTHRHWDFSQLVAGVTLTCLIFSCWVYPAAWPLAFFAGGIVALGLTKRRDHIRAQIEPADPLRIWPFDSLGGLRLAVENIPTFRKQRHRPEVAHRRVRSPRAESALRAVGWLAWVFFAPFFLMGQALPVTSTTVSVVNEGVAAAG